MLKSQILMKSYMSPEEFKAYRKRAKMSAAKYAAELGVSQRVMFYYENGDREIPQTIAILMRLLEETKLHR